MKRNVLLLSILLLTSGAAYSMEQEANNSGGVPGNSEVTVADKEATKSEFEAKANKQGVAQYTLASRFKSRLGSAWNWIGDKAGRTKNGAVTAIKNHKVAAAIIAWPFAAYIGYSLWNISDASKKGCCEASSSKKND